MPLPKLENLKLYKDETNNNSIDDLDLLPVIKWDEQLVPHWKIGEKAALKKLEKFNCTIEIRKKGGEIFFALLDNKVVGTCAVIKIDKSTVCK